MILKLSPPSFWYEKSDKISFYPMLLSPLAALYGWIAQQRFDLYHPVPMARPVVCVGNVVAGGAGKTPVSISLAGLLQERGHNPHLLTRGYGGAEAGPLQVAPNRDTAEDVGDEALLLVNAAPTWVSRNRALGAQAAMDTGASVVIMDDGFQNPSMYKDFSILVVDGGAGFGNGRVMPAGPLREPLPFALSRADAVVIVGEDRCGARDEIARHVSIPVFSARLVPLPEKPDVFGKRIFAFAGIGRPEKFRETLVDAGAIVEGWGSYPDHFAYLEEDLKELFDAAEAAGAPVLTTDKDYVRLPPAFQGRAQRFSVRLEWEDSTAISTLVDFAISNRP